MPSTDRGRRPRQSPATSLSAASAGHLGGEADRIAEAFTEALQASIAGYASPRDKLLGVFDFLYEWFDEPDFHGCPFINAFAEADNAGAVTCVVEDQKHEFATVLRALVADAGGPPELAEQLFILAHGAMVVAAIRRSPAAAREAQRAADGLIAAQMRPHDPNQPGTPNA